MVDGSRRPITIDRDDRRQRGQTTQDFAIGVGVFLIAVAFAFTAVPAITGTDAGPNERIADARTDQIATAIVGDLATDESPTELDGDRLRNEYADDEIQKRFGLRTADGVALESVRITLETIDRETELLTRGEDSASGRPTDSVERLVSVGDTEDCQVACRLVVEVWR
ncbi:hypothetical protein HALLA_09360 [Halostagnicola larsenii XH-48]|uniref:Uncharacterized protein n=1 Tax=Halostagnicola larsenii XH-48 TaxID=797299 RepID=W0JPE9_9EURY|nr:hypothetical protein [Halostagnicola larsenii]AHF99049.1 hypothetical protein HALLA_09360 [Halostagnicola larsenii XH-48]